MSKKQEFKIAYDEFVFRCSNPNYRQIVDGWLEKFPPTQGQDPLRYAYEVMLPDLPVGPRVEGVMRCGDHLMTVSKAIR